MENTNKSQTLEDIIGGGFGGSSTKAFAMVSMRALDSPIAAITGGGSEVFGVNLEKMEEEQVRSIARSGDALFYLISAIVAKNAIEELIENPVNYDDEPDNEAANYGDEGEIEERAFGSWGKNEFSRFLATMVKSALDEGGKVVSSPYLVSRRRMKTRTPVESPISLKTISNALSRSIEVIQKEVHEVHLRFALGVALDKTVSEEWFLSARSRHEKALHGGATPPTRFQFGIDISGVSAPGAPPLEFFADLYERCGSRADNNKG